MLAEFSWDFQTTDGSRLADELRDAPVDHSPKVRGVEATANKIGFLCDELPAGILFRMAS